MPISIEVGLTDRRLANHRFQVSLDRHRPMTDMLGPFHRVRSASQSEENERRQVESGLLLGDVPHLGGKCPTVQAYVGPLPDGAHGIEFLTATAPHQTGLPPGFGANWYLDDTAFTGRVDRNGRELAAITIVVVRWRP